jgi:hypothetical protein
LATRPPAPSSRPDHKTSPSAAAQPEMGEPGTSSRRSRAGTGAAPSRSAAIASRSLRRSPTIPTPISLRSSWSASEVSGVDAVVAKGRIAPAPGPAATPQYPCGPPHRRAGFALKSFVEHGTPHAACHFRSGWKRAVNTLYLAPLAGKGWDPRVARIPGEGVVLRTSFTFMASCFRLNGFARKWMSRSLSSR